MPNYQSCQDNFLRQTSSNKQFAQKQNHLCGIFRSTIYLIVNRVRKFAYISAIIIPQRKPQVALNNDNRDVRVFFSPSLFITLSRVSRKQCICRLAPFEMLWNVRNNKTNLPCNRVPWICWGTVCPIEERFPNHGSWQWLCAIPSVISDKYAFGSNLASLHLHCRNPWNRNHHFPNTNTATIRIIPSCILHSLSHVRTPMNGE